MQVRKRIAATTAIAGLAALAMAGSAQAHYSRGQITCPTPTSAGSASFDYTSFPGGPNVVNVDLTVDTLTVQGSGKAGFTGSSGRVSLPFTVPADGRPHNVVAVTSWQQDGGGTARVVQSCMLPAPVVPPAPPAPPVPPTVIERTIEHTTIVQVERKCTSRRVASFKVRRRYPSVSNTEGPPVLGVVSAETLSLHGPDLNGAAKGDGRTTFRHVGGRWVVRIDFRDVVFTGFDNSTRTTVVVSTPRGNRRLIYKLDQCRPRQGNPNDANARDPEIPVR